MPPHSEPWLGSVYTAATGQRRVDGRGTTLPMGVDVCLLLVEAITSMQRGAKVDW